MPPSVLSASSASTKGALKEFYARQIVMPELREEGQQRLRRSRALLVGLGGMGSVSSLYLTLAGIGFLRLIDLDTVEAHNLHRQALYTAADLRYPKVEVAAKRLMEINPEVKVEPVAENLRASNVDEFVRDVDCIVDGLDNMWTRYVLNRASFRLRKPYVFGGAIGLEGNITVFRPPATPCLECIFPGLDDRTLPTCETRGVLGATTGSIGALQAIEAVKLLSGIEGGLEGRLLVCDLKNMDFLTISLVKSKSCPVCGEGVRAAQPEYEQLTWLCGRETVNVSPPKPISFDAERTYAKLEADFQILLKSPTVIVFKYEGSVEVSLFKTGRMLIKSVKDERSATEVFNAVRSLLL